MKEANDMVTAPMLAEHFEAGDFGRDEKSYKLVLGGLSKKGTECNHKRRIIKIKKDCRKVKIGLVKI